MKLLTTFLVLFYLFCSTQSSSLSGKTLYSLNPKGNQLTAFSFDTHQHNTTDILVNGQRIVAVLQGNYITTENRYVVFLDLNNNFNVGYINVVTGNLTSSSVYQTPSTLTFNNLDPASFGFDPVTHKLYAVAIVHKEIYVAVLNPANGSPSQTFNTGMIVDNGYTGGFYDQQSKSFYVMNVPFTIEQYVVVVFNAKTQTLGIPLTLQGDWTIDTNFQSSILSYNGSPYITQLCPPGLTYVFQAVLSQTKPKLVQVSNTNLPQYVFSINLATITSEYIFYVSAGSDVPFSVFNAMELSNEDTVTVKIPYSVTGNDIIFVQ